MGEMKRCLPVENGGCGREKSVKAFPISKYTKAGYPEYRPRCFKCMSIWKKLPVEIRNSMSIQREYKKAECVETHRTCCGPEFGGCGETKPIDQFQLDKPRADGSRNRMKRCKPCQARRKRMSREEREGITPLRHGSEEVMPVQNVRMSFQGAGFFHMPATNCSRVYQEVGRACSCGV